MVCQVQRDKQLQIEEEIDWRTEVKSSDDHNVYQAKFLNRHSEFYRMWDVHLRRTEAAKRQTKLNSGWKRPIPSASSRASVRAREFEKHEMDRMLAMDVIKPTQTKSEAPKVLAPKEDGTLRFCMDYCNLNAGTLWDFSPILCMDECMDIPGHATISRHWTLMVATGK